MVLIFILYFLFASTFTLGKSLVGILPPFFLIGVRMLIGGCILLGGYIYTHGIPYIRRKDWFMFGLIAFFHIYVAYLAEFWSLQYVSAAKTALLYNLSPFITAIFARYILHERLSLLKIVGLTIGILGMIPILSTMVPAESSYQVLSFAEEILLVSIISSALGWILIKKMTTAPTTYPFLLLNAVSMVFGGFGALLTSICTENYDFLLSISSEDWVSVSMQLGLLIIIANIICYNLYAHLLGRYSATLLSFAGFLTPVCAAFISWLTLGEVVENQFWFSWGLSGIGSLIFYVEDKKRLP